MSDYVTKNSATNVVSSSGGQGYLPVLVVAGCGLQLHTQEAPACTGYSRS